MSNTSSGSGIARSGGGTVGNPYIYSGASAFVNRPVNFVSYRDSCRFSNWLHSGQPTGAQGPGTTERGAYTLDGYNGSDGRTIHRNLGARWALPTEDEWYKAAYYKGGSAGWPIRLRPDGPPVLSGSSIVARRDRHRLNEREKGVARRSRRLAQIIGDKKM
ncbi:MAG TPA: hypothetical protein VLM89_03815 [Phycisphaerae bacterium]|nr:hypothetical protein [Phycisphaerae bacterium]